MSILSDRINEAFAGFMREVQPTIPAASPEWFTMKKGYIAGLTAGSGFSEMDEEIFLGFAADFYAACDHEQQMAALFEKVPPEHRIVHTDGRRDITEQGMIHLATTLEQERPHEAEYIRQVRYALQRRCGEEREG